MKTRSLALTAVFMAATMFVSCDFKETFDLVRKPIHVQGEIDPTFGMPIANGQVTLNELLDMLGSSSEWSDLIVEDSSTITIRYKMDQVYDSIVASSMMDEDVSGQPTTSGKPYVFTKDNVINQDTIITYGVDIDFWDDIDVEGVEPGNLAIHHLWLDFNAKIMGDCPESAQSYINSVLHAKFDNVKVEYDDYYGVRKEFQSPELSSINVAVDNILTGDSINRMGIDLAQIIDDMPRHIDISFRFDLGIDEEIFGVDIMHLEDVLDSIGLTKLYYWLDAKIEMPLDIQIGSLPYVLPIDLGENVPDINSMLNDIASGVEVGIKDSRLVMSFENHMPIDLGLEGWLLDGNGDRINNTSLFNGGIGGAPVNALGIVNGVERKNLDVMLNSERLQWLSDAEQLEIRLSLGTSRDENGNPQYVKIRRDDFLKVRMYALLHPQANVDISVK